MTSNLYKKLTFIIAVAFAILLTGTGEVKVAVSQSDTRREAATTQSKAPSTTIQYYASLLSSLPITLRPGSQHRSDSNPTPASELRCRSIVYKTLATLPKNHSEQLKELTLFYTPDGRRGLGGNGSVVLRCMNVTNAELASVLTHEIAHLVDGTLLTGTYSSDKSGFYDFTEPVAVDDPSLAFYKICWLSDTEKKSTTRTLDFVSEYAMSDPFEDFAETYAYYRLHGSEFKSILKTSAALRLKYEFMRDVVFNGQEFTVSDVTVTNPYKRNYDITILPFKLKSILG